MFEHRKQPFVRCSVTLQVQAFFYDCEVKSYRSIMRYLRYKCTFNSVATILERWRMFHNLRIWAATNVSGLPVWPAIWKADIWAKASSASDHSSKRDSAFICRYKVCTGPWPQPHPTYLGWTGMVTASQALSLNIINLSNALVVERQQIPETRL